MAADLFVAIAHRLRSQQRATLGVRSACSAGRLPDGMRTDSLRRIDSFPYRHRVAELMSAPLVSALPEATLAEASRLMSERGISSVVTVDTQGRPSGILTERDILRVVAMTRHGCRGRSRMS